MAISWQNCSRCERAFSLYFHPHWCSNAPYGDQVGRKLFVRFGFVRGRDRDRKFWGAPLWKLLRPAASDKRLLHWQRLWARFKGAGWSICLNHRVSRISFLLVRTSSDTFSLPCASFLLSQTVWSNLFRYLFSHALAYVVLTLLFWYRIFMHKLRYAHVDDRRFDLWFHCSPQVVLIGPLTTEIFHFSRTSEFPDTPTLSLVSS